MSNIVITVRAIILHQGKLLMCRQHSQVLGYYNLPGGKLMPGETLETGLEREILEETGVAPQVGQLLFINQFITDRIHRVEFFFNVTNSADYVNFDPSKASHGYEIQEFAMDDPANPKYALKPDFLRQRLQGADRLGADFSTEIVLSR